MATIGKNQIFEIKNGDGTPFHNLVLRKSAVESVVMSLGDKISGDVYYKDNTLSVTMHEYITYNGVNYMLINPPTIVREGVVSGNGEQKGMTKYSFVFYHPMCQLSNFPFTDVAVTSDETRYLSESKTFSWIGKPADFIAKMNKNLAGTEWIVELSSRFPQDKLDELSDVIPFDKATIADACKTFYDTWGVPYVVDKVASTEASYATGKRFKLVMGLPSNEIYENAAAEQQQTPFVFQMGHGVGLKNNSRTPRNNKIITRISGHGSENNIPYGYPQVRWFGTAGQSFTYGDHAGVYTNVTIGGVHFDKVVSYPIYKGILNGEYVELIKHSFTRTHLMPSVYRTTLFNKISLYNDSGEVNTDYDPDITLVDFYDAVYSSQYPYPNTINLQAPSYESHEFEDEKPELGEAHIISATPLNKDLTPASSWDDSLDDEGNYNQSYFQMVLPQLSFDLYACASITEEMQINMRSGACLGCTFTVQVDWDDYKRNFYDKDGNFAPNGSQRDLIKYPKSNRGSIALILQKDNSTFGTLMPNMYQYPNGETSTDAGDGDSFVILGISLPESYIFSAEWRLDEDMKSYMLENNVHYYDYPLKFDEDFLFHNENILSQIHPNTIVRFDYAGQTLSLFVKQLTIKYGDQPLPQYDITLTDNIEVTLNQIGQVAEDVESLSTLISILRQSYGKSVWSELSKKLSKVDNDIAYGDLDLRGHVAVGKDLDVEGAGSVEKDFRIGGRETVNELQSTEYTGDGLLDTGYRLWYEEGRAKLVIDDLVARGKFTANELETRIWTYAGGNMVFSGAGSTLFFVEYLDGNENPLGYTYINQPWLLRGRALLAGGLAWSKRKAIQRELTEAEKAQVVKFRCYEYSDDGTMQTRNWWKPNDIAMCETLNKVRSKAASDGSYSGSASNTVYKRRIAGIGSKEIPMLNDGRVYDYVDLWNIYDLAGNSCKYKGTDGQEHLITDSVKGYDSTYHDWPAAGDVIVQMGNPLDTNRQAAVTIEVQGDVHGFKVYDTISDYSMANKLWVEIGYDQTTGKAKANVFGDFRFGCRENEEAQGGSYIKYNRTTKQLDIRANVKFTSPTTQQETSLDAFANAIVGELDEMQAQIDGQIEAWFYDYAPVSVDSQGAPTSVVPLNVEPYKTWNDADIAAGNDAQKIAHLGDTFTNDSSGYSWRFTQNATTQAFEWNIIEDSAVITALQNAARAQDTADHKRRVFICDSSNQTPTPPYDAGDLWVNVKYPWATGATYDNEMLKCVTSKASGASFSISDWSLANGYTAKLNNFVNNTYAPFVTQISNQVDKKAETFRQAADPSVDWYDDTQVPVYDVRVHHVGDIWMDISADGGKKTKIYQNTGTDANPVYGWVEQEVPDEVFDEIDGKAAIYVGWNDWMDGSVNNLNDKDLFIPNADVTPESGVTYKANKVYRWKASNSTWNEVAYTDDTYAHGFDYLKAAMKGDTQIQGGLLLSNTIVLRNLNGTTPTDIMAGMNGVLNTDLTDPKKSIAAWYGGDMVDLEDLTHYWTAQQIAAWEALTPDQKAASVLVAKSLDRFDGSGYRASGNISWNAAGDLTIKGQVVTATTKIDTPAIFLNGTDITSTLNAILGMFELDTTTVQGETLIKAKYSLYSVGDISAMGQSSGGGGGGGGASVLYELNDVLPNAAGTSVLDAQEGYVLTCVTNGGSLKWKAAPTAPTYVLPQATSGALGGIKIGFTEANKNYAVQLDNAGKAYVNVPWTDTTYDLSGYLQKSGGTMTGILTISVGSTSGYQDGLVLHDTGTGADEGARIRFTTGSDSTGVTLGCNSDRTNLQINGSYTLIHSGNYSSYALPLTGGTVSGVLQLQSGNDGKIVLNNTDSETKYQYISFKQNGAEYGTLGTFGDENLKWKGYTILHSNNYSSYALPLSGGTVTGATSFNANVLLNSTIKVLAAPTLSVLKSSYGLRSDYESAGYPTEDYLKAWCRFAYANAAGYTVVSVANPSSRGYIFADFYNSGVDGTTGLPRYCTGRFYNYGGASLIFGTTDYTWYSRYGIDSSNIGSQSVSYATSAGSVAWGNVTSKPSAVGGATTPVYWTGSGFTACTAYSSASVNYATSAGKATNDSDGNAINSTYLKLGGGTMTGLLKITTNSRTLTLGAQNSGGIHIYNDNNSGFYFNGSICANSSAAYDLGSTSYPWRKVYLQANAYIGTSGGYLDIVNNGNEMCIGSSSSNDLYINYRASSGTKTITKYVWRAGSSSSWAQHYMGALTVNGDIYATGDVTAASDERQKCDIEQIDLSVEQIANAPAIKFSWKDGRDNLRHVGSFAQYWQKVLPESVTDKNDILGLNYGSAALVSVVKVAKKVLTHEEEIEQLRKRISELEHEVEQLKSA